MFGFLVLGLIPLLFIILGLRLRGLGQRFTTPTVAFFHPYCNAGGGGERVLWQSVLAVQEAYPDYRIVVYTGDKDATPDQILGNAKSCFGLEIPANSVNFIYLRSRWLVEAKYYPIFTLLGQSLGSIILGFEAMLRHTPAYYIDSMGYAFTFIIASLCGCDVIAYVHYPTISTDMLNKVISRESSYNNASFVAKHRVLSVFKLYYYKIFAWTYGVVGRLSSVVFVNSSWTQGHIEQIWNVPERTHKLYPPCNTEVFLKIDLSKEREKKIVSVAQFRPEKNHALQIASFKLFLDRSKMSDVTLTLIGGVRNKEDEERVAKLESFAKDLGISDLVKFKIGIPFIELYEELSTSLVGLHTMRDEHFGIGIVEFMAAGVIPIAHNSGGPKMDIVVPGTGYLATTADEYSDALVEVFAKSHSETSEVCRKARAHIQDTFSDAVFKVRLCELLQPILEGGYTGEIDSASEEEFDIIEEDEVYEREDEVDGEYERSKSD